MQAIALKNEQGRSYAWIAEKIGESKQAVYHWMSGKHVPADAKVWDKILGAFGVSDHDPAPTVRENSTPYTKNLVAQPSRRIKIYAAVSAGDGNVNRDLDVDELNLPADVTRDDYGGA